MDRERRALIFASTAGENSVLNAALQETRIKAGSPRDFSNQSDEVSLVVVDRIPSQALLICANLRKEERFKKLPILVLLDGAERKELSGLSALGADVLFKPVIAKALIRYLNRSLAQVVIAGPAPANAQEVSQNTASKKEETTEFQPPGEAVDSVTEAASVVSQALEDVIPTSSRLLQSGDGKLAFSGGLSCAHCDRWNCRRDDRFCSRCGRALAVLEIGEERVILEPLGDHRVGRLIELTNAGQNPVLLSFLVSGLEDVARRIRVVPADGVLYGGSSADLLVTFDARGLDLTNRYRAALEITSNENGGRRHREVVIEPLSIPTVITRGSYQYAVGGSTEWEFTLANKGGGTLKLERVLIDEIELTPTGQVFAQAGDSVPVRLGVPALDIPVGSHQRTMTWHFGPYGSVSVDLTIVATRPPRLTVQPPELDFGVVSTMRSAGLHLELLNGGGEDLIVDAVNSPFEWAECPVTTPIRISKATAIVDVQIRGSAELEGDQSGEITIQSNSYQSPIQAVPFRVKFVVPEPYEEYIGIDFGTSASCVAVLDSNKRPMVIDLEQIEAGSPADPRIMPSALYFHADGSVAVGREALQHAIIQPANAVTSIKRVLGLKGSKAFGGREYTSTELASEVISQLVRLTEGGLFQVGEYKTPRRAVVTTPVEFLTNQRSALLDACKLTGLTMGSSSHGGSVIDEAHAAALHYLTKRVREDGGVDDERLLIFDFGGGTLDCALIDISSVYDKIVVKTLAPGGDPKLGGEDIDWALVNQLGLHARKEFPDFDIDCLSTDEKKFAHKFRTPALYEAASSSRATFKRQAEMAKISLSTAPEIEVSVEPLLSSTFSATKPFIQNGHGRACLKATLRRDEVEQALSPFINRAVESVEVICERAGVSRESVNTILHVGRTSLIPILRARINQALPNASDRSDLIEPKLCVALGAAYWGYIKDRPNATVELIGGPDQLIHDIGYLDVRGLKEFFIVVFPAYTQIPRSETIEFPKKDEIVLRLAENRGRARAGTDKTVEIGVVRIDGRHADGCTIPVGFRLDENRVLEITANGRGHRILEVGAE